MSPQPRRNPDAKVEGRDESQEPETSPHERFRALAKGILAVPMEQVREAERKWQAERQKKARQTGAR
jgi:hypothetical protein